MPRAKNPWAELLKTDKRRSKGSLEGVQQSLWWFVRHNEAAARRAVQDNDLEMFRKLANTAAQLAGAYARIAIDSDIEQRIKALEAAHLQEGGR